MSDNKVFYVNYTTGSIVSNSEMVCDAMDCEQCPYYNDSKCGDTRRNNPEKFLELCGYVPVPFSVLPGAHHDESATESAENEKHYVLFPSVDRSTVYALDESQYNMVRRLQSMGACEYDDVDIDTL